MHSSVRGASRVHQQHHKALNSPRSPPQSPPRSPMATRKLSPLKQIPSPRRKDVKFSRGTKQHDGRVGVVGAPKAGTGGVSASVPAVGGKMPALRKCPSESLTFLCFFFINIFFFSCLCCLWRKT